MSANKSNVEQIITMAEDLQEETHNVVLSLTRSGAWDVHADNMLKNISDILDDVILIYESKLEAIENES